MNRSVRQLVVAMSLVTLIVGLSGCAGNGKAPITIAQQCGDSAIEVLLNGKPYNAPGCVGLLISNGTIRIHIGDKLTYLFVGGRNRVPTLSVWGSERHPDPLLLNANTVEAINFGREWLTVLRDGHCVRVSGYSECLVVGADVEP